MSCKGDERCAAWPVVKAPPPPHTKKLPKDKAGGGGGGRAVLIKHKTKSSQTKGPAARCRATHTLPARLRSAFLGSPLPAVRRRRGHAIGSTPFRSACRSRPIGSCFPKSRKQLLKHRIVSKRGRRWSACRGEGSVGALV
jgi:hypothetical protein